MTPPPAASPHAKDLATGVGWVELPQALPSRKPGDHAESCRKLDQLDSAERLEDLRIPPGNRRGQHSIRINQQYRICFRWSDAGPLDVQIVDCH